MLVGRIIGRTSPEKFQFEVTGIIRKMDFIAVKDPERHWILGRVEGIIQEKDKAIARVSILGFSDKRGNIRTPRMPFRPGSYVYKADDGLIKRVLGLKTDGLYVGLLDNSESLRVTLDPKKLITKHLAILAKTGTGKSYFASVLMEEFIENKIPAVIIDPHGEYSGLREPNQKQEEIKFMQRFKVHPKGYKNNLQIFCLEKNLIQGTKKLKLNGRLGYQEIFEMLPFKLTASQLSVLYSVIKDSETAKYTLHELKKEVESSPSKAKWNVLSVLDYLSKTGIFDTTHFVKPENLVKKGKMSIVNMRGVEPDIQQLLVYKIIKDLFEARKAGKIPAFLLVVEEAHNFCPERGFGGEVISSKILRTIASEGRKFGMGLTIISQRPARVDKNVLSQCTTQVFLRITNPNDLKSIIESVEGVTRGIESEIRRLPIGTGLIVGAIDHPLIVDIRIKRTNHAGAAMIVEKRKKSEESDTLYFHPKFLEEDVKKNIRKRLEQFRLFYYPLWRLSCKFKIKESEKIDNLFLDGLSGELVFCQKKYLGRTSGLTDLLKLNIKEKAVLLYLTSYGVSNSDDMAKKLRINERKLGNIIEKLEGKKLISKENEEFKSNIKLNFEQIIESQIAEDTVSYKYSGEKLPFKIGKLDTNKVLDLLNPDEVERKKIYYPYWLIFYEDGNVDVVDALTGEKDKFLTENFLDELAF